MNKSKTPTSKKVMTPLRLDPELFSKIQQKVYGEKLKGRRGYSINEYITDLVDKDLKEKIK